MEDDFVVVCADVSLGFKSSASAVFGQARSLHWTDFTSSNTTAPDLVKDMIPWRHAIFLPRSMMLSCPHREVLTFAHSSNQADPATYFSNGLARSQSVITWEKSIRLDVLACRSKLPRCTQTADSRIPVSIHADAIRADRREPSCSYAITQSLLRTSLIGTRRTDQSV